MLELSSAVIWVSRHGVDAELTQLERGKSMMRYLPLRGRQALHVGRQRLQAAACRRQQLGDTFFFHLRSLRFLMGSFLTQR
jgi:hypothetical protein